MNSGSNSWLDEVNNLQELTMSEELAGVVNEDVLKQVRQKLTLSDWPL